MIRKRARLSLVGAVALAALLATAAQPAPAADLIDSWQHALQSDPDILGAEAALAAGREKAVQGDALRKPQVGLSASLTRLDQRSTSALPEQLAALVPAQAAGQTHQVAVQLVQPLYDPQGRAERQQLHQQAALAEVGHADARQQLVRRVGEAYFALLLAEESLRVVQAEQAAVGAQRDRAQARFEVGRGKITDLEEARARYDTVVAREVSARATLQTRRAQFRELTGLAPDGLAPLAAGFAAVPPQPDDALAWEQRSEQDNLRVQRRQRELAIAAAEIGKTALAGRPSLDLVAGYTDAGRHAGLAAGVAPERSRSAAIGLQFSVPLYAGGAIDSRQRESIARRGEAEQQLAAARRDARLQAQDGYLAVKTGVARIAALEQTLRSARTALVATTLGRDLGNRTELDVLDAQQRVFSAELDLARARNDYLLGRLQLAAAAGALGEPDLLALNAYLAR